MTATEPGRPFQPDLERRKAFLLLRWLLVILASYLTLFSYLANEKFNHIFGLAVFFYLTQLVLQFVPRVDFEKRKVQLAIAVLDVVLVASTLYLLRDPETPLYIAFLAIFLMTLVWREFKLVLFSIFVVSVLFGVFQNFRLFGLQLEISFEDFLTQSLFFVVSIFYVFLSERMKQDAALSAVVIEEKRYAEVMVEVTRAVSSSLNSDEILFAIVSRLRDVLNAIECSIIRVDTKMNRGYIMVKSGDPKIRNVEIDLMEYPELIEAYESRRILVAPQSKPDGLVAVPMISRDTVLGLIHVRAQGLDQSLSEANLRFFEMMASTAANALRNAQLFEEVEHRARTDFLTELPNHRFFQTTLSTELARAQRHNHPLSLLIIDLDFLKEVNDRFGHPSGDMVIRSVANTIRSSCREFDFAARYGGEEFTVILPETPLSGAVSVADRIRERIAAEQFPGIGSITASVGISNYPANALNKEDLIRVADQALYVAKNGGRDRVAHFNYQMVTR
jgi:diguanylate cyclase (GGDEF)-like protein